MNRYIHQIWVGPEMPERFRLRSLKIEALNPLWEMRRWDQEMLINEFPDIQEFIDLGCPEAFISNWARIRIWQKYGGWYIDYDFEGYESLDNIFNEYLPIIVGEFNMPGYTFQSGFAYFDRGYPMPELMDYLPHEPIMSLFNNFVKDAGDKDYYLIPQELVSTEGQSYKEERMRSFYLHPNFNNRLVKINGNYKYVHKDTQKQKEINDSSITR